MRHANRMLAFVLAASAAAVACSGTDSALSNPTAPSPSTVSGALDARPGADVLSPADVTFADGPGHAITSDGNGPYVNSQQGFESGFHSITKDFVLRYSDSPRYVNVDYTNRLTGLGPMAAIQELNPFIRVAVIQDMSVGETRSSVAVVSSLAGGSTPKFWFNPLKHAGATLVNVHRADGCTWTVAAVAGVAALEQTKGNKVTIVGTYSMPFGMEIRLQECS